MAGVDPDRPVRVTIEITGDQLDDVTMGLLDVMALLHGGRTRGHVTADPGRNDGYKFSVTQL